MINNGKNNHLIWIDLETTGLDPARNYIIEIATIVTDAKLNILAEGPVLAIFQTNEILDAMDDWNTKQHNGSGLVKRIKESHIHESEAEQQTLEFLKQHVPIGKSPMCGNSICFDRRFLARHMPQLEKYFHYRNLDVSTVKELSRLWAPKVMIDRTKESKHLALEDIRNSINELKYYKEHFLRCTL